MTGYAAADIEAVLGVGKDEATERVKAFAEQSKPLLDVGPPTLEEREENNVGITNIISSNNDADYRVARIARDRPDILDRMKAGEYRSVYAAAIDARWLATMDLIKRLISDDPEAVDLLDRTLKDTEKQGDRTDLVDNIHEVAGRPAGTSKQALIRRLRKNHPDLHARVLAGELSANAAMVMARPGTETQFG